MSTYLYFQTTGVGKLRPNILMVGFKTNWEQGGANNMDNINTFYEIVLWVVI